MTAWHIIKFKPLNDPLFRAPSSVFDAGIHGPAVAAASLTYPMPSTISGALAHAAYATSACNQSRNIYLLAGFSDHKACIKSLLGEDFTLRPGLIQAPDPSTGRPQLYAYTGTSKLTRLDALLEHDETPDATLEIPHTRYTGIALDKTGKTPEKGMLYHALHTSYTSLQATIIVLAHAPNMKPKKAEHDTKEDTDSIDKISGMILRLGGEGKTATLEIEKDTTKSNPLIIGDTREDGENWEAILLTPALIDYNHATSPNIKNTIIADETLAQELSRSLKQQSHETINNCTRSLEIIEIPRNEYQLQVISPGWSIRAQYPREPYLLIPPGTRLEIKADRECVENIARHGLGAHSNLGWGTTALKTKPPK